MKKYLFALIALLACVNAHAAPISTGIPVTIAQPNQVPLVSGRFYGLPLGASLTTVLTQTGIIYAYPFYVPTASTIKSVCISVTTGQTGGAARAGIYADNGSGAPGALVAGTDAGALAATANAVVCNNSLSIRVAPGIYWGASRYTASSTFPTVAGLDKVLTSSVSNILGYDTATNALLGSSSAVTGVYKGSQTYGAMPSTFPLPLTDYVHNAVCPVLAIGF